MKKFDSQDSFDDQDEFLTDAPMPGNWNPETDKDPQWSSMVQLMAQANKPATPSAARFDTILRAAKADASIDDMPENWNPDHNNDAQWQGMIRLMHEANSPAVPKGENFDAILNSAKLEMSAPLPGKPARIESVFPTKKDESFGAWISTVATGGGVYAQALRFGAVAATTALVMLNLNTPDQSSAPAMASGDDRVVTTIADAASAQSDPSPSIEVVPPEERIATTLTDNEQRNLLNANSSTVPVSLSSMRNSGDWRALQSDPSWQQAFLVSNANNNPGQWAYGLELNPKRQDMRFNDSPEPFMKERLMKTVQQMRFQALLDPQSVDHQALRQLESSLRPLLQNSVVPESEIYALELYQRADDLALRNRFDESILVLEEIENNVPASFMSFLSRYRIANIEFENLGQYDHALSDYKQVLEQYPSSYMTDSHLKQITSRVDLMLQNYEPGWEAMKTWRKASMLSGADRFESLKDLVENHPHLPVASQALDMMYLQVLTDPLDQYITAMEVSRLARFVVTASPQHPEAARIMFNHAEIALRRLHDLELAKRLYGEVAERPNNEQFLPYVSQRLKQIATAEDADVCC